MVNDNLEQHVMPEENDTPQQSIDLIPIARLLRSKIKRISLIVVCTSLFAIGFSYVLQESFISSTILLPETDKGKLSSLGGLSDLASLAGVNIGGSNGSLVKLYPTIVKSEAILNPVIYKKYQTKEFPNPVNLIEYWEIEEKTPERSYEVALKNLSTDLNVSMDNKTSVLSLSIEMPEAQIAADILNATTEQLDAFVRNKRTTSAVEQRRFVESRLDEVKKDLTASENKLKEFREQNRQVFSPQLLLEQERLIRDVQINAAIYTELRKQYEIVKIEEVKNIPVINILDPARPAAKKAKPKRAVIVISFFLLSIVGSVGYYVIDHLYGVKIKSLYDRFRNVD